MNWTDILPWPIPAWYKPRVTYDKRSFCLVIEIHKAAQAHILHMLREWPDRLGLMEREFEIPSFILPRRIKGWGFGEILTLINRDADEWFAWECPLPRNFEGGMKKLHAVVATLEIIFSCLRFFEEPAEYYLNQLLLVEIMLRKGGDYGVEIILSPQLTELVNDLKETAGCAGLFSML